MEQIHVWKSLRGLSEYSKMIQEIEGTLNTEELDPINIFKHFHMGSVSGHLHLPIVGSRSISGCVALSAPSDCWTKICRRTQIDHVG